jgi:hypothetical protein
MQVTLELLPESYYKKGSLEGKWRYQTLVKCYGIKWH